MTGIALETLTTVIVAVGSVVALGTVWLIDTIARRRIDVVPAFVEAHCRRSLIAGDGHLALWLELCRNQSVVSGVIHLPAIQTAAPRGCSIDAGRSGTRPPLTLLPGGSPRVSHVRSSHVRTTTRTQSG